MFKNTHLWLGSYLAQKFARPRRAKAAGPVHLMVCVVDHYEPEWRGAAPELQRRRVRKWMETYPLISQRHCDADGRNPRHTFFYPAEAYQPEHLEALAGLCRRGFGEVEVHLHHDGDTEQGFREKLLKAKDDFSRHGLLGRDRETGELRYAFIHGNWALNNSRPDGRWCGVDHESRILVETGCYADLTFPSAPSNTQPAWTNRIYYDLESSQGPKSHNTGAEVTAGSPREGHLLLVQGPLTLNWRNRSRGIFPRIENSDLTGENPPTEMRADYWVDQHIHVRGRPEWVFIKLHTHGAQEKNWSALLGEPMERMWHYLETEYNDGRDFILHYVTAREMVNIIKAAEQGKTGNPAEYRDALMVWESPQ